MSTNTVPQIQLSDGQMAILSILNRHNAPVWEETIRKDMRRKSEDLYDEDLNNLVEIGFVELFSSGYMITEKGEEYYDVH